MNTYNINFSISKEKYIDKNDVTAAIGKLNDERMKKTRVAYGRAANHKISMLSVSATAWDLYQSCISGHTFCHVFDGFPQTGFNKQGQKVTFRRADGTFSFSAKCNDYFQEAWTLVADIDHTTAPTVQSYLDNLPFAPTFWYSSFSHTPQNPRFRLVYVLHEPICGTDMYTHALHQFNLMLYRCTGEIPDTCNERPAQYYNGTCIRNAQLCVEHGWTGKCYDLSELIPINPHLSTTTGSNLHTHLLSNTKQIITPTSITQPLLKQPVDTDMLDDIRNNMPMQQLLHYHGWKHTLFYRMADESKWINNQWQFAPKGYFKLPYYRDKTTDGHHRRAKVAMRMCLRRIILPTATVNDLILNARADVERQFDNQDNVFTAEWYRSRAEAAMQLTPDEIEQMYAETLAYLRSKAPKDGIILRSGLFDKPSDAKVMKKNIKYGMIRPHYNPNLSLRQNLAELQQKLPFPLSLSTLQSFTKTMVP